MALKKPVRGTDGVVTEYHRILSLSSVINVNVSIAVLSYIDEECRNDTEIANPYCKAVTYSIPYQEDMTIEQAYEYLKENIPAFEGAEDV